MQSEFVVNYDVIILPNMIRVRMIIYKFYIVDLGRLPYNESHRLMNACNILLDTSLNTVSAIILCISDLKRKDISKFVLQVEGEAPSSNVHDVLR